MRKRERERGKKQKSERKKQQQSKQKDIQRVKGEQEACSVGQSTSTSSYLAMSSGLCRKWRSAVRALRTLRGTGAAGGGGGGRVGEDTVNLLLFLVSPPSQGYVG